MRCISLLGLDNGSTSTKAALFDTEGRQIGVEAPPPMLYHPRPRLCGTGYGRYVAG